MSVNSRLKATWIVGQWKASYRKRMPERTNIYQSNTYRKDLGWPHFDNKSRDCIWTRTQNHLVLKEHSTIWPNWPCWPTIECGFTLKRVRDMTRTYRSNKSRVQKKQQVKVSSVYVVLYSKNYATQK